MLIISKNSLSNTIKEALYKQNYLCVLNKYGLFFSNSEAATAAVDELVSLALLGRPSTRKNCRIAKLIEYINSNNEQGVAELIASVGREAAKFERANYLAAYSLAKQNDSFYFIEYDDEDYFKHSRANGALEEIAKFKVDVQNGFVSINNKTKQLSWNFAA